MDNEEMLAKQAEAEVPVDRKGDDMKLYAAYKKDPAPHTFQPLYRSFKPFIFKAARGNMIGSPIPQSAHMALGAQSFLDALRTFSSDKGTLHSHVYNTVREKGKRLNYKYQNIGYIPEARATKYQLFKNTEHMLKEALGREASTGEMADELKWSPKMVETLRREMRSDLVLDEMRQESHPFARSDRMMQMFHDLHPNLNPVHQLVLEHAQGMYGKPMLTKSNGGADVTAIAKASNIKVQQVRSALKTISRKAKEYMGNTIIESELGIDQEDTVDGGLGE